MAAFITFVIVGVLTIHAFLTKRDYTVETGIITILSTSVFMMILLLFYGISFN